MSLSNKPIWCKRVWLEADKQSQAYVISKIHRHHLRGLEASLDIANHSGKVVRLHQIRSESIESFISKLEILEHLVGKFLNVINSVDLSDVEKFRQIPYNSRTWLNAESSPSTGAVVCYVGNNPYTVGSDDIHIFFELSSCSASARFNTVDGIFLKKSIGLLKKTLHKLHTQLSSFKAECVKRHDLEKKINSYTSGD